MAQLLTKRTRAGQLYIRPGPVETNIDGALGQDLPTLRERLKITDRQSSDFLTSECLIHLFRRATERADVEMRDVLVTALLVRCEGKLILAVPDNRVLNAALFREEILQEFALVLANDGGGDNPNELDYFECRFDRAFKAFRIDVLRRSQQHQDCCVAIPSESVDGECGVPKDLVEAFSRRACQEDDFLLAELLDRLPSHIRKAVVLVCVMGYEAESDDPNKATAATICNVTGRTIRNWLSEARQILSQYNQETV